MSDSYEHTRVWQDGPVTIVSLNRPDKGNAISRRMAEEVQRAMLAFDADPAQRAAVLTAVEGWCIGGAMVLAMMADLCVCGAKARFYYPEAKLGLTGGMIAALPSRIPHKIAMEIMLLCREVGAERAAQVGLVNEVVPEGEALARAIAWGREMAGFAPLVTGAIKRMVVDEILPRGPSERWALQGARLSAIRESEDFREGVAAFRDKRPPAFKGR